MVDNNQFLMPLMVTNQMNEMATEQFQKVPPPPVGMTGPILVMHPDQIPQTPHQVIMQNPVQVVRHPPPMPPPPAPVNGFQYRLPQHTPIMGGPTAVVYPSWNQNFTHEYNNFNPGIPQQQSQGYVNSVAPLRERKDSELSDNYDKSFKLSGDENNLIARRNEVLSRLRGIDVSRDDPEEDAESHVSFTVANAVLFDDVDSGVNALDFPPLPIQPLPKVPTSVSPAVITEAIGQNANVPWGYSWNLEQKSSRNTRPPFVRTVCPTTLLRIDSTKPATVQSDCSIMNIKDAIDQPLVTAIIQQNNCKFFLLVCNISFQIF